MGYRKVVSSFQPDVVLHSTFHHISLLAPLFRKERNVFHVHEAFASTSFYRQLFKALSRRICIFVGVSKYAADALINIGVPESKVRYVLNGITADQSSCSVAMSIAGRHREDGPVRIGIVGQIDEWKGHEDLIDALHILETRHEPFVCRIFGSGSPEFAVTLESRIAEYKLTDRVEWMGFVSERKFIYDSMDICIVPSRRSEAFGMVAAEASMYGIPVVASRKGALPEVICDNHTGYLVDAGSAEQIADKISALSISRETWLEMGQRANAHVSSSLSAAKMVDEMESLFERLIAKKSCCEKTNIHAGL
jgi:glycosyltransferase involved in cell wall biosynthesis